MALKAIVSKLDDVEESLRSYYRPATKEGEPAGSFILDVEPANGVELRDFTKLLTALQEERGSVGALTKKLKAFEAFGDPDALTTKLSSFDETQKKLAELTALDPKREADKLAEAKVQAIVADLQKKHGEETAKLSDQIKARQSQIESLLIDNEAKSALSAAGVLAGHDGLLLRAIRDVCRVVEKDGKSAMEIIDASGNARIKDANRTPFEMADLIAEMKATYPGAFTASDGKGPGVKPGSSSGNGGAQGKKLSEMSPGDKAAIIAEKGYEAFQAMLKAEHPQAA